MSITLIAGLGNPGREYAATRHNLGFTVVEALASAEKLSWQHEARFQADIARWNVGPGITRWLVKPQTFMNESGRALRLLLDFHKLPAEALAVAYDDLTIDLGRVKVTESGSAGGHNGVASLLEHVGNGFARYRLGIANPRPAEMDLKDFVLGKFTEDEKIIIAQQLTRFVAGLRLLIESGCAPAMNSINRREKNDTDQA
jgi:PTH1 family peptidyl-tRNA hydrolase